MNIKEIYFSIIIIWWYIRQYVDYETKFNNLFYFFFFTLRVI